MSEPENSCFGVFCLMMTASTLPCLVGYHFVSLNPLTPVLQRIYNETYLARNGVPMPNIFWTALLSITVSFAILGGLVGSASVNAILRYISRKRLMQLSHVVNIVAVLFVALIGKLTSSYEVFIIGRFITGFSFGISYSLLPLMVAEMCARPKQGFWQSIVGVANAFGFLVGSIISHPKILGSYDLWPAVVCVALIPTAIYLVSSLWIPNTPFYLLRHGGKEVALEALLKMRTGNKNDIEDEISTMENEMKGSNVVGIREILASKQYRRQLIAVFALFANIQLVGINNFVLYSDLIFIRAGVAADNATFATIGIFTLQFVMSLVGTKLVDRFGGRKAIIASNITIIFALTLFIICQAALELAPNVGSYLAIVATAIFMVTWSGGLNLATLALLGELTIEPTRPTTFGYGGIVLWTTGWFVGFIPEYLEIGLGDYAMTVWLICSILFLIYFIKYIPETKGRSVEEIQAKFKSRKRNSNVAGNCNTITNIRSFSQRN